MRNIISYTVFFISAIMLVSCEYYIGLNQQPEFKKGDIEKGLNIFSLLRADTVNGLNKSFAYVHQLVPVLEPESFNILKDADFRIERVVEDQVIETFQFTLIPGGTVLKDTMYHPVSEFTPLPGERYRMTCKYEGLPDAVGETVFPPKPLIIENSIELDERKLSFELTPHHLIGMIDIYHNTLDTCLFLSRLIPSASKETLIELFLPAETEGTKLLLYSYDQNMAVYCGNANISLNFNKYRTTISTLQSGYGVFGSMNFSEVDLDSYR
ncbi:MAG: hypothetical protein JXB00_10025 [Bacteroidales bacterium]|nr:hypothetical protein [Bacteroidales bacterium]